MQKLLAMALIIFCSNAAKAQMEKNTSIHVGAGYVGTDQWLHSLAHGSSISLDGHLTFGTTYALGNKINARFVYYNSGYTIDEYHFNDNTFEYSSESMSKQGLLTNFIYNWYTTETMELGSGLGIGWGVRQIGTEDATFTVATDFMPFYARIRFFENFGVEYSLLSLGTTPMVYMSAAVFF